MFGYRYISHRAPTRFDFPSPDSLVGEQLIELTEEVRRAESSRFLCVCKLDDIWQLHRAGYEARCLPASLPFLLDLVKSEIGQDLSNGRCFVLFDLSGEGHPFVRESFEDLHGWCQSVGLARDSVGLLSQNRAMSSEYYRAYGKDMPGVHFFYYDSIIHAIANMFASPEGEFLNQFSFSKLASLDFNEGAVEHPFLCMNATPRPLRVAVLAALSAAGLLPRTIWSLLSKSSGKGAFTDRDVQSFLRRLGRENDLYSHALNLLSAPDKCIDDVSITSANQLVWSIDYSAYMQTCIALVTETDFTEGQVLRVTEKTIKALAMARPLILFGNPQSLSLVRTFGFQTFHPMINEAYDEITNMSTRFAVACNEIERVNGFTKAELTQLMGSLNEITMFNAGHARSGGLNRQYRANVELPFWNGLCKELSRSPADCRQIA